MKIKPCWFCGDTNIKVVLEDTTKCIKCVIQCDRNCASVLVERVEEEAADLSGSEVLEEAVALWNKIQAEEVR
jgi:hypothetical protein